jgi:hypothetical protein
MRSLRDDSLRDRLRDVDPAGGPSVTPVERERLRARLLGAAADPREAVPAPGGLRLAWAGVAAAALVTIAFTLWWLAPRPATTERTAEPEDAGPPVIETLAPRHSLAPSAEALRPRSPLPASGHADLPARRTIYFTAPRGTRLVWVVPGDRPEAG